MIRLPGFNYLINERKLCEETIRTFQLGYATSDEIIYIGANFCKKLPELDFRFKNSVIFPIFDLYGSVIGVSSKTLSVGTKVPKYVNTVYDKANHLYGLYQTWNHCVSKRKVYVVEGNIDVLQMYQAGINNVVGMLGSNFSLMQFGLLYRFVQEIVFVPDGDKAGINFLNKVISTIPKKLSYINDIAISMINLPVGQDPDKFLLNNSAQKLFELERVIFNPGDLRSSLHV